MLKPAICYKDEIEKLFMKELYSQNYFYYAGYAHSNELPKITVKDYEYQYAIVTPDNKVIGYLAYRIDAICSSVYDFGLYSFDKGNYLIGIDLYEEMEKLVSQYHRVEWKMIGGNPVQKHYDKFCKKHKGHIVVLHDVIKDELGKYHDEYIYEIINKI
jgi:triacylglycerol esterase/lipase EstA (alpha/beta hydrolase family)